MTQALEVNLDFLSNDEINQNSYVLMTPDSTNEVDDEESSASAEIEEKPDSTFTCSPLADHEHL